LEQTSALLVWRELKARNPDLPRHLLGDGSPQPSRQIHGEFPSEVRKPGIAGKSSA
jgi:hypothetical protein